MKNEKQTYLNGKPLWKCKHSELTKYAKDNGLELKPGLKTYQIASAVKNHLENSTPVIAEENEPKKEKKEPVKRKAVKKAKGAKVKQNESNITVEGFAIGDKVALVKDPEKIGVIDKLVRHRGTENALVKFPDGSESWKRIRKIQQA